MQEVAPILSIVIPCYNHGLFILEALDSIENAKGKFPLEIIIVNDGSTDESTLKVLNEIKHVDCFVLHQQNGGLGNARNNGIKMAKGKYILPLDSDNNVLRPYLNEAISILESDSNISVVYGNAVYFGEQSGTWKQPKSSLQRIMLGNSIDACAVFRKSVWIQVNGYAEDMPVMGYEDWEFWLKLYFHRYTFYYLEKDCFMYRVLSKSMIRTAILKEALVKQYLINKYNDMFDWDCIEKFALMHVSKNPLKAVNYFSYKAILKMFYWKLKNVMVRFLKLK